MRILILSFYYPPDVGPGALRAKSIVDALTRANCKDISIDVITTMPNRYHSLDIFAPEFERHEEVAIRRLTLPEHKSGIFDQARAFGSFAIRALRFSRGMNWDLVFVTSSRLMTASLGAWISRRCEALLYVDIRDLFTDTINDLFAGSLMRGAKPALRFIERWTLRSANIVNVVSPAFVPYIETSIPGSLITTFTNGIDEEFINKDFSSMHKSVVPEVLYAGNIGRGQDLHQIIPDAARRIRFPVKFKIIGDGGARIILEKNIAKVRVDNVVVADPIQRSELFLHYEKADILFLHLSDFRAFKKVIPSKIFEYAATGKPILAGVTGYPAEFICDQVPGVEIFYPGDVDGMCEALTRLLQGPKYIDRANFCVRYRRKNIADQMVKEMLSLSGRPSV